MNRLILTVTVISIAMRNMLTILFLCIFWALIAGESCSEDFSLDSFPEGVFLDIIALFTTGLFANFVACPSNTDFDPNNIGFYLWTNDNSQTPVVLNRYNPNGLHKNQHVIILIHGWLLTITNRGMFQQKDAYLKRYPNANVIAVEWLPYAYDLYSKAFCVAPKVASVVAEFISNIHLNYNINLNNVHIVGHSIGAQISGLVGQAILSAHNEKIGRITGLDPAGPLYQTVSKSRRLDASDAKIVDVIHTNQGMAGFYGATGTVDFFPNCGYVQPGCSKSLGGFGIKHFVNLPLAVSGCSHMRSIDYHIESIYSDNFIARSCKLCPGLPFVGPCIPDHFNSSMSVMGEDYLKYPGTSRKYFLRTNDKPPYARGYNAL